MKKRGKQRKKARKKGREKERKEEEKKQRTTTCRLSANTYGDQRLFNKDHKRKNGKNDVRDIENKAVYTTAPVAYGWAGAVLEGGSPFGVFSHWVTDQRTDRVTRVRD